MAIFKNSETVERINGRAAMVAFDLAVLAELSDNKDLVHQMFNVRSFTLMDGAVRTVSYPGAGLFLAFLVAGAVVAGTAFPVLKKVDGDAVNKPAQPYSVGPITFTPEAELKNGRWAMMGLASLYVVEQFLGKALL